MARIVGVKFSAAQDARVLRIDADTSLVGAFATNYGCYFSLDPKSTYLSEVTPSVDAEDDNSRGASLGLLSPVFLPAGSQLYLSTNGTTQLYLYFDP